MTVTVDKSAGKRVLKNFTPPEGVPLQFTIAGMGSRFGAQMLDLLITYGGFLVLVLILAYTGLISFTSFLVFAILVLFFLRVPYYVFSELVWNGRTLGKRMVKIRVISADGTRLTPYQITARNVMKEVELFLPITFVFGFESGGFWSGLITLTYVLGVCLVPFFNKRRQRLGDMIAGTLVVEHPQAQLLPDLTESTTAKGARFTFSPDQLGIYGRYELQTLERILRQPPKTPETRQGVSDVVRTIRRKIRYPDQIAPSDEWEFLTEFYRKQREFLESRQLFGDSRENKFHDQEPSD